MPDYNLPNHISAACKKGLKYHRDGFSGDGLQPATVRQATRAVEEGSWSDDKIIKAAAWFARHESDLRSDSFEKEKPRPGGVAWLLWGSDPATGDKGREWLERKAEKIKQERGQEYAVESDPSTPAPPKDRIKGSDKNEPGTAAADGGDVEVSEAVETALKNKLEKHLEENPGTGQKTTLAVLRKVYRRGAGAYSTSHRPNVSRAAWAMARVNAFLYLLAKGKPKNSKYITDNDLLPDAHPIKSREQGREEAEEMNTEHTTIQCSAVDVTEEMAMEDGAPIHVLRMGPLHDLDSGDMVTDFTPELLAEIATTTQAIIEAGHPVPVSLEHGIEAGHRGDTTADRRPYGMIKKVWYDSAAGAVYALKEWTALGANLVGSAMTKDGRSAWRISPRVKFGHAYHPETGESLGKAYMDVISLVTLPRQNSMEAVPLSRDAEVSEDSSVTKLTGVFENDTPLHSNVFKLESGEAGNDIGRAPMQANTELEETPVIEQAVDETPQETEMARRKADEPVEQEEITILLARGSDEACKLYEAAGVKADAEVEELTRVVNENRENLAEALVELSRFKAEDAERKLALRQREVDEHLAGFEFATDGERDLYRAAMLSDDGASVEMARTALAQRTAPDHDAAINEAITEAKARGAVAADFDLTDEAKELARQNPEITVLLLSQIPAGMVVRTGEPVGSDAAGLNESGEAMDRDAAAEELSRIARAKRNDGEFTTLTDALKAAREERPDLGLIVYPQEN